jgi:UDP-N-acetylmuramate dehydrogenase
MKFNKFLSLKEYNTFGVNVESVYSFFCYHKDDLKRFLNFENEYNRTILILGSGSNILFTSDFNGTIIFMRNKGISIVKQDNDFIYLKAEAGEIWDDFVKFCVVNNFGGVENLSLIPGTVGAAPVQNIGAYGSEVKSVIDEIEALNRETLETEVFKNEDCQFGYRESIFKKSLKNKYIILNVTFKLTLKNHKLNLEYGSLNDLFRNEDNITLKQIREAVIQIRTEKLPSVEEFPNAGSFFKNPVVSLSYFNELKTKFPNLISYFVNNDTVKLAAGQLIDLCNWKGKQIKGVGVHYKQALVIVNYNNASGKDILEFSKEVEDTVFKKFGVYLEREVNLAE